MKDLSSIAASEDGKSEASKARSESKPRGNMKPGRLIIRNLQYDIKEKHLIKCFAKFGQIVDVNVPLNPENNLNKGFGFVEFKTKEEAVKAIGKMNAQKYKGRLVSVDFALSKKKYDNRVEKLNTSTKPAAESKDAPEGSEGDKEDEKDWEISSLEDERDSKAKKDDKSKSKIDKKSLKGKDKAEEKQNEKDEQPQNNRKRDDKRDKKNFENDAEEGKTLFVRNIDYNATEKDIEEFFGEFGQTLFVKLVKSRENPDAHKGMAFVKFTSSAPVEELAKISDEYWSTDKTKASKAHMTNLESQLELRGRRLAMFKAETRSERKKHIKESKEKEDKRNLDYLKFGLVTTKEFVHSGVSQSDMDTRVRLFQEKQKDLKKNPNLFISKTRLCIRNIDRRMNEKQLNEFIMSFCNDWKDTQSQNRIKELKKVKLINQLKILRNPDNLDDKGKPKSTGIGFVEACDENLAIYLVRNLNNFITNLKREKGLIVDFATEDHRKLLKRKQKLEAFGTKLKQAKKERKKKMKEQKEKNGDDEDDKPKVTIDQVNDVETLKQMLVGCNSRGRRSRINKKIQRLTGEVPANGQGSQGYTRPKENGMMEPDQALKRKEKPVDPQIAIEKKIAKDVKKSMKRKRKLKEKSEEEVDTLLKSFEERIQKKLKKLEEAGDEMPTYNSGGDDDADFNNVEVEEM